MKLSWIFDFGEELLDPPGKLRLEGRARHVGRRADIHVFEDERLDLRLRRFDRGLVLIAPSATVGRLGGDQRLQDVGDQVAARKRIGLHRVADKIRLHRGIDDLGEIAAREERPPLRPDLRPKPSAQLLAGDEEAFLNRCRRVVHRNRRGHRGGYGRLFRRRCIGRRGRAIDPLWLRYREPANAVGEPAFSLLLS